MILGLDYILSYFLMPLLEVDFIDTLGTAEVTAVGAVVMSRSFTQLPMMVIDADNVEHLPGPNADVYPADID